MESALVRNLSVANGILGGIYALDNAQRIMAYGALLWMVKLKKKGAAGADLPLTQMLSDFYGKINDARFMNRFFCLPSIIQELLETYYDTSTGKWRETLPDDTESVATRAMAWSMVPYYPLDHLCFLATLKPNIFGLNADRMSRWSCIAWTVYIIGDIVAASARISKLLEQAARTEDSGEKESKIDARSRQREDHKFAAAHRLRGMRFAYGDALEHFERAVER